MILMLLQSRRRLGHNFGIGLVNFDLPVAVLHNDSSISYINVVAVYRARLVLGLVTTSRVQILDTEITFIFQPPRSTQPGHTQWVDVNEYWR